MFRCDCGVVLQVMIFATNSYLYATSCCHSFICVFSESTYLLTESLPFSVSTHSSMLPTCLTQRLKLTLKIRQRAVGIAMQCLQKGQARMK
ncbi:hypothetical protein GGI42DRAFT_280288 [Trichoderma sp. SZMC 28013]